MSPVSPVSPVSDPTLQVWGVDGVPEVQAGDDLATLLLDALDSAGLQLRDGDVVTVTSKVVSKSEGAVSVGDRASAVAEDTVEILARRGSTAIVRTRHGIVLAAAGVDASNTAPGTLVRLPADPDDSARRLRSELCRRTRATVGVVVTDTAGRPWRLGQTDMAIGAAGVRVLDDHAGRDDPHGNPLTVTAPAVPDEAAGAAELATRKTAGRPFALLRGLGEHVTVADGPGAAALVRPRRLDMFALGAREAVLAATAACPPDAFGSPVDHVDLVHQLAALAEPTGDSLVGCEVSRDRDGLLLSTEAPLECAALLAQGALVTDATRVATALGWHVADRRQLHDDVRECCEVELTFRPGAHPAP